jgi:hypothetical protein
MRPEEKLLTPGLVFLCFPFYVFCFGFIVPEGPDTVIRFHTSRLFSPSPGQNRL